MFYKQGTVPLYHYNQSYVSKFREPQEVPKIPDENEFNITGIKVQT